MLEEKFPFENSKNLEVSKKSTYKIKFGKLQSKTGKIFFLVYLISSILITIYLYSGLCSIVQWMGPDICSKWLVIYSPWQNLVQLILVYIHWANNTTLLFILPSIYIIINSVLFYYLGKTLEHHLLLISKKIKQYHWKYGLVLIIIILIIIFGVKSNYNASHTVFKCYLIIEPISYLGNVVTERSWCFYKFAENNQDIKLCNQITNNDSRAYCVEKFLKNQTDDSLCKQVDWQITKDYCYKYIAIKNKDVVICNDINQITEKYNCYVQTDPSKIDLLFCDQMAPIAKEQCYLKIAMTQKNWEICKKITNAFIKSQCAEAICNNINDINQKRNCYLNANLFWKD